MFNRSALPPLSARFRQRSARAFVIFLPVVLVPARDFVVFCLPSEQVFGSRGDGMNVSARMQRAGYSFGLESNCRVDRHEISVDSVE